MNVGEMRKLIRGVDNKLILLKKTSESYTRYLRANADIMDVLYSEEYNLWNPDLGQNLDTQAARNWLCIRTKALIIF